MSNLPQSADPRVLFPIRRPKIYACGRAAEIVEIDAYLPNFVPFKSTLLSPANQDPNGPSFRGQRLAVVEESDSELILAVSQKLETEGFATCVSLLDVVSSQTRLQFSEHRNSIYGLECVTSAETNLIVSGDSSHNIFVYPSQDGEVRLHTTTGQSISRIRRFGQDSVLVGGGNGFLRVLDLQRGGWVRSFDGHANEVWDVGVSPDGTTCFYSCGEKTVRLWDRKSTQLICTLPLMSEARSCFFREDRDRLVVGQWGQIDVYDTKNMAEPMRTVVVAGSVVEEIVEDVKDFVVCSCFGNGTCLQFLNAEGFVKNQVYPGFDCHGLCEAYRVESALIRPYSLPRHFSLHSDFELIFADRIEPALPTPRDEIDHSCSFCALEAGIRLLERNILDPIRETAKNIIKEGVEEYRRARNPDGHRRFSFDQLMNEVSRYRETVQTARVPIFGRVVPGSYPSSFDGLLTEMVNFASDYPTVVILTKPTQAIAIAYDALASEDEALYTLPAKFTIFDSHERELYYVKWMEQWNEASETDPPMLQFSDLARCAAGFYFFETKEACGAHLEDLFDPDVQYGKNGHRPRNHDLFSADFIKSREIKLA